jgi:hypothetical protein
MAVSDVVFLMMAIAFVLVALLSIVATLDAGPKIRRIANGVIYGCMGAALVSVVVAAWFLYGPPV